MKTFGHTQTKKERKKIIDTLKHPSLPYPRDAINDEEIEEIFVGETVTTFY